MVEAAQAQLGLSLGAVYFWSGNIVSWLFLQQVQVDRKHLFPCTALVAFMRLMSFHALPSTMRALIKDWPHGHIAHPAVVLLDLPLVLLDVQLIQADASVSAFLHHTIRAINKTPKLGLMLHLLLGLETQRS